MSFFIFLKKNKLIKEVYFLYQSFIHSKEKIKGKDNVVVVEKNVLNKSRIKIFGNNNRIEFKSNSFLETDIFIKGNNNKISIGENCTLKKCKLWIEDDHNDIFINDFTTIENNTDIACVEGQTISLGKDCMISSNVIIRTTDSHSIIDMNGQRINYGGNVEVGDHVWIGNNVTINKNVSIGSNNIISSNSLVTKSFTLTNAVIGGVPSKVIKENINWLRERI